MKITKSQLKEIIREELFKLKERKETGLYVTPKTERDRQQIEKWLETSDYHAEWNQRDGYWLFPEEKDMYDELEMELDKAFGKKGINARFEGI